MSAEQLSEEPYELTNLDREMLEFERLRFKYAGAREAAVYERFDLTLPTYTRRVLWLIEQPAAERYDPVLVRRLVRLRDLRRRQRSR